MVEKMNHWLCDELFEVTRLPCEDSWSDSFMSNVLNDGNLEKTSKTEYDPMCLASSIHENKTQGLCCTSSEAIHSFFSGEDWHPNRGYSGTNKYMMSNFNVIRNMECPNNQNPSVHDFGSENVDSFVDDEIFKEHHIQELWVSLDGMLWDVNNDLEPMEFQRTKLDGENHGIPLPHTENSITYSHYSHKDVPHFLSLTNNNSNNPQTIANVHGHDLPKCDKQQLIKKRKGKGQPAKNLMAERRRRKRLNDRLSMLRSIVPTITKVDKTSILSDTIDYAKRLADQVRRLKEELEPNTQRPPPLSLCEHLSRRPTISNQLTLEIDPIPTLDAEETRSEHFKVLMKCPGNSNMLLSTVKALEFLGLDIPDGKFSCFGDFSLQIICSHDLQCNQHLNADDIHLALAQTTGYTPPFKP